MQKLRLILDPPRPPALNMAVDEYLMQAGEPALRFYSWDRPSVSIGYFQSVADAAKKFKGLPVVRRISGGGSVRHGEDLTFSLALPVDNPFFPTDVKSSYLRINEAVRTGLKDRYAALDYADCRTVPAGKRQGGERICFDAPACYDLLLSGKKVLGASQRRIGKDLLHQSALFLSGERAELIRQISEGFKTLWKVALEERALDERELAKARQLEEGRYLSEEWASGLRERSFAS